MAKLSRCRLDDEHFTPTSPPGLEVSETAQINALLASSIASRSPNALLSTSFLPPTPLLGLGFLPLVPTLSSSVFPPQVPLILFLLQFRLHFSPSIPLSSPDTPVTSVHSPPPQCTPSPSKTPPPPQGPLLHRRSRFSSPPQFSPFSLRPQAPRLALPGCSKVSAPRRRMLSSSRSHCSAIPAPLTCRLARDRPPRVRPRPHSARPRPTSPRAPPPSGWRLLPWSRACPPAAGVRTMVWSAPWRSLTTKTANRGAMWPRLELWG